MMTMPPAAAFFASGVPAPTRCEHDGFLPLKLHHHPAVGGVHGHESPAIRPVHAVEAEAGARDACAAEREQADVQRRMLVLAAEMARLESESMMKKAPSAMEGECTRPDGRTSFTTTDPVNHDVGAERVSRCGGEYARLYTAEQQMMAEVKRRTAAEAVLKARLHATVAPSAIEKERMGANGRATVCLRAIDSQVRAAELEKADVERRLLSLKAEKARQAEMLAAPSSIQDERARADGRASSPSCPVIDIRVERLRSGERQMMEERKRQLAAEAREKPHPEAAGALCVMATPDASPPVPVAPEAAAVAVHVRDNSGLQPPVPPPNAIHNNMTVTGVSKACFSATAERGEARERTPPSNKTMRVEKPKGIDSDDEARSARGRRQLARRRALWRTGALGSGGTWFSASQHDVCARTSACCSQTHARSRAVWIRLRQQ